LLKLEGELNADLKLARMEQTILCAQQLLCSHMPTTYNKKSTCNSRTNILASRTTAAIIPSHLDKQTHKAES